MFLWDVLSHLGMGAQSKKATRGSQLQSWGEPGDWIWKIRGRVKNLKFAYMFHLPICFSGSLGWRFLRECLLEFVAGIIECWGGRSEKVCWAAEGGN